MGIKISRDGVQETDCQQTFFIRKIRPKGVSHGKTSSQKKVFYLSNCHILHRSDVLTIPVNIAGIPCISVPCGFSEGLPIGMQVMGKALSEETILNIAYTYQQATDWHTKRPALG